MVEKGYKSQVTQKIKPTILTPFDSFTSQSGSPNNAHPLKLSLEQQVEFQDRQIVFQMPFLSLKYP